MKTVALGEIANINPRLGRTMASDEPVSFVPMAYLSDQSAAATPESVRPFGEVAKGYTPMLDGDLLVAKITPCFENGKIGQAQLTTRVGMGSTEFHVVRPSAEIDARYLLHFLRTPRVNQAGRLRMTGSGGQRRVPAAYLEELGVPLPPIDEQRRIATILDHVVDLLRVAAERERACRDLVGSQFIQEFGDPLAGGADMTRPIGEIGSVTTGNTPPRNVVANYGSEVEWIKSDNIILDRLEPTPAVEHLSATGASLGRTADAGDLLVVCIAGSPASIGRSAMLDRTVAFNQQINAISLDDGHPRFLLEQLRLRPELVRGKSTGGMKGLVSKSALQSVEVLWPSVMVQQRYIEQLGALDVLADQARKASERLMELASSVQARAFNGEL